MLGLSEAQVLARGPEEVPAAAAARFAALLDRRLTGEPVAYLFGEREFYGRPFFVDSRVLVPRPETEHLIETALDPAAWGRALPAAPRILDLGTGSGCIAVTLALELPAARVMTTDRSVAALACAARNRERHGVGGRVALAAGDWAAPLRLERFDLVVSNPPYIDPGLAPELSPEVREFEPAAALFAPDAGLGDIAHIVAVLAGLRPPGLRSGVPVLFEIGDGQLAGVRAIVAKSGLRFVEARTDYAGKERVVVLKRA